LPQANHASRRRSPKQSFAVRQDAQARVQDLERELRVAEGRDRVALGDALLEGRKAPASEADAFRKSLEGGKRDAEALAYAEERCASELNNLPKQRKEAWLREAERDLKAAGGRYRAAIVELKMPPGRISVLRSTSSLPRWSATSTKSPSAPSSIRSVPNRNRGRSSFTPKVEAGSR
jgi:hypothetical protein